MTAALMLAAPTSGAGKTTLTLAILRALRQRSIDVRAAKSGPDYIDPAFHAAACGRPSFNLDAWAMPPGDIRRRAQTGGELLVVEAAMGVLDGAGCAGAGSAADLAATLNAPVVLIIDAAKQAQSVALPALGLKAARPDLTLAGVILNRVASPRHRDMAAAVLNRAGIPLLGAIRRSPALSLPERHLGLVQAIETPKIEAFLNTAAEIATQDIDLDALLACATPLPAAGAPNRLPPLGNRIAIAQDQAFTFAYPHLLDDWQAQGASLHVFTPLADQAPDPDADAIFLPGGYPELHATGIANAYQFRNGMQAAANAGKTIYGECGGYMVLGETITDADGHTHPMLGLLPVETSFADRKLSLGYRRLTPLGGPWETPLTGHEFHYATIRAEATADRLFAVTDADGTDRPEAGLRRGTVAGSFMHVIAPGV
ncbi:cobyrinate a,c-diamide synthase [Halovulum sp. GXIMD14793]